MSKRTGTMTDSDLLYGFRLRLFALAEELGNVRAAGATMRWLLGASVGRYRGLRFGRVLRRLGIGAVLRLR